MPALSSDKIHDLAKSIGVPKVAELVSWSSNYHVFHRPLDLFFDITGVVGQTQMFRGEYADFGFVEVGYIGEALVEYSNQPNAVERFFIKLDELEQAELWSGSNI